MTYYKKYKVKVYEYKVLMKKFEIQKMIMYIKKKDILSLV
jgi:hypothetical protein